MTEFTYAIRVLKHNKSDLLMALVPEVPGFIVHAYSIEELANKLASEFKAFMDATERPVSSVEIIRDDAPPDFWPPAFVAKASMTRKAAA